MKKLYVFLFFLFPFVCGAAPVVSADGDDLKKEAAKKTVESAVPAWEFYSVSEQISEENLKMARKHKLGKEVGYLYDLFMDFYVHKEEVVPGDPTRRTVIRKPNVYNAVRSIEKELNKDLKQNKITQDEAAQCFTHVLRVALAAIDTDSDSFEEAIQGYRKDQDKLISLFENVKLRNIY